MNWYKRSQSDFDEPPKWEFPEAEHDYDPNWDYNVVPNPDQKLVAITEEIMSKINNEILPEIGMGKAKAAYIKENKKGILARYVYGTSPYPVFVVDLDAIKSAAKKYKVNIGVGIETTIMHELGHAIQDWMGLEMDENQAEEFARHWYDFRQIFKFWE